MGLKRLIERLEDFTTANPEDRGLLSWVGFAVLALIGAAFLGAVGLLFVLLLKAVGEGTGLF
jgi:hypothetical protein